jgi:hypothetical protein
LIIINIILKTNIYINIRLTLTTMEKLLEANEINNDFLKKIYDEHYICSKEIGDLILFYHKYYNNYIKPDTIQSQVRSIIYNKKTKKIVSDCGPNPIYNDEAYKLITDKDLNSLNLYHYYDGTVMSVFFAEDKWYLTTRRCLDSKESFYNSDNSHYSLFNEVLENTEYKTFETLTESLEKDKSYYFILIHYKNKQVLDYSNEFGSEYKRLCLFSVKDSDQKSLNTNKLVFVDNKNIFVPTEITNNGRNTLFLKNGNKVIYNKDFICYYENKLLIFNTTNYQLSHIKTHDKYSDIVSLFFAYQNDILYKYDYNNNIKLNEGTFKSADIVSTLLKISSSYMLLMFKQLYSINNGNPVSRLLKSQANIELNQITKEKLEKQAQYEETIYNALPSIYKEILYAVRGIYYKKKSNMSMCANKTDAYLNVHDIYNYLKYLDVQKYIQFIKASNIIYKKDVFKSLLENISNNMKKLKTFNVDILTKYYYFVKYIDENTGVIDETNTFKEVENIEEKKHNEKEEQKEIEMEELIL